MSKITIIEGNSNDKDNVRNYLVKGEKGEDGVSPTVETSKTGDTATVTFTDGEGTHSFDLKDGISPTITSSKTGKVTTLTIVDAAGTKTATINDGEDGATTNIIDSNHLSDDTTQTFSGRIIAENMQGLSAYVNNSFVKKDNIVVLQRVINIPSGSVEYTQNIEFPTGFTKYNSIILNCMWTSSTDTSSSTIVWRPMSDAPLVSGGVVTPNVSIEMGDYFHENDDDLNITFNFASATTGDITRTVRIVLMKLDPDVSSYELGDINMDGEVTEDDKTLLQNYITGTQTLTDKQVKLADMNEDGTLNSADILLLTQKINS